jgi:putative transposon-encoded protein
MELFYQERRTSSRKRPGLRLKEEPPFMESSFKFEVFGEEMIEKEVKLAGNSGRIYLPPDWIGKPVKIIRIE